MYLTLFAQRQVISTAEASMRRSRIFFYSLFCCSLSLSLLSPAIRAQEQATETVTIDANAPATPLPHFWEQMFGSGRAVLSLRESYRNDLRQVRAATGFKYVRFHAIFHDELGVYDEDKLGNPVYNFSYVDQIYDGLLANGVKPFVELSFTPRKMASRLEFHAFWYKPIPAPPVYSKWDPMITAFAQHLIDRYGIDEVASWYFEVWNEPNIDFWTGRPAQQTYFELYDHTARALKAVNERIRVGGPSTAQAAWVDAIIAHTTAEHVPLDFVSTHVYGNDASSDVFPDKRPIAPHQMVCAAVAKVHDQIKASARPTIPLIWSEFNATYANEPLITDTIYMGPWMADTIRKCDGMVDIMSYWSFSDVFEEQGVVKEPFYGGYGLIAAGSIPKPAFRVFSLLHLLGDERIASTSEDLLVTKRADGTLVIAAWNLVEPPGATGAGKTIALKITGQKEGSRAYIRRVDADHGDTLGAYNAMGRPRYPSQAQLTALRQVTADMPAETQSLSDGILKLRLPSSGLAVIEIRP
ncbi:MAG TPA: glycosyl hydrolase family 39 [Acidisarcina sp.]